MYPRMAVMGVRISWLKFARKAVLAALAALAVAGEGSEVFELVWRELPRDGVDDAEGAGRGAVREPKRDAGVEADVRRAKHQGVVGRARVVEWIGDDEGFVGEDGVGAEGLAAGRLFGTEPTG